MLYYISPSDNPFFNMALEEYLMKAYPTEEDSVMLWQSKPAVLIGRHQYTPDEINAEYVRQHGIIIARRITGGGAVYQDMGNVNFSFITRKIDKNEMSYHRFMQPVVDALRSLGVPAEFNSRNDIAIEGRKVSGNAQHAYGKTLLHHGTLLFHSDLTALVSVLNVSQDKLVSKGIRSVAGRVGNISDFLSSPMTMREFQEKIINYLIKDTDHPHWLDLTDEDLGEIQKRMDEKFALDSWNYNENPGFSFKKSKRFTNGKLDIRIKLSETNKIQRFNIYGDFLSGADLKSFEDRFIGLSFQWPEIQNTVDMTDFSAYFGLISKEEFLECLQSE